MIVIGGCRQKSEPKTLPKERHFAIAAGEPQFLDPNILSESSGRKICDQMFQPLVTVAPWTDQPVPGAAERWTVSEDGKTYTFYLRKGLKWSDGVPLDARDFLYSWNRAMNPETGSRNASQYWNIIGARAYNKGETTDFNTVGLKLLDNHTLQIELVGPAPYFVDLLTYVVFSPTPRHAIEKHGKNWTRPENIVVNGPFKMVEWKVRDRISMARNPEYWDKEHVWLDKVTFFATESEVMAQDWYEAGKVHWTPGLVPVEQIKKLLRSGRSDYHIIPVDCVYYYIYNVEAPPFDDVRVRRAFNMALDKGLLVRQVLGQGQEPASHLVPPHYAGIRGYPGVQGDPFDPARARELLAEAGYGPTGKPLPPVTLIYNTYEAHRLIAEFYQRSIKTHLGIDIQINNMEWKTLLGVVHGHQYQIARTSWCADFPDPEDYLKIFHSQGENNYSQFKDPAYDKLLGELKRAPNLAERNRISLLLETMLNHAAPISTFYYYTRGYMLREWVRGIEADLLDRYQFQHIWFGGKDEPRPKEIRTQ